MPIALDPNAEVRYVLKAERDLDEPTVFILRPLPARVRRALRDGTMTQDADGAVHVALGTAEQERVAYGLVGWEGWRTAQGEPVAVEFVDGRHGKRLIESVLDRLRDEELSELSDAIADLDTLDPRSGG